MHFFGLVGLVLGIVGVLIDLYFMVLWLLGHKIGDRSLFVFGSLFIVLGIQFVSTGFLGEFFIYLN